MRTMMFGAVVLALTSGCTHAPSNRPRLASGSTCVDFQAVTPFPQTFAGPAFTIGQLAFQNPTQGGTPRPLNLEDRVEDHDGKPELFVGFSRTTGSYMPLVVRFPSAAFPQGVRTAYVRLQHFSSARVIAKNTSGATVAVASQPTQHSVAVLTLRGPQIARIEFDAVETLVYDICWV